MSDNERIYDDLKVVRNFLDWEYATHGSFRTEEFHRTLVATKRPMPTIDEARVAMTRIEELIDR